MRYLSLFILLFLLSCSRLQDQPIEQPSVSKDFYYKALKEIQVRYDENPSDRLLRQKLYYYEQLGWPKESIQDLNLYLESQGLNRKIVSMFLQYYLSNEQHADLVEMLDKWEFYNGLDEELSQYRILSNIRANGTSGTAELLSDYTTKFQSPESFEFATRQALHLQDSSMALDYLSQLQKLEPNHNLILSHYVPMLQAKGAFEQSLEILYNQDGSGFEYDLSISRALYGIDSTKQAKNLIARYDRPESNRQLMEWYRQEDVYDSAILYLDKLIVNDTSRNLLFLKAQLQDKRGWYNSSYAILGDLIKKDSTDSIAIRMAEILARKIAYLRRLKEQQLEIPELKPKRVVE